MTEDQAFKICDVVPGHMHEHQMRWLYQQCAALPDGAQVLEIGSADGRSTCMMAHALKPKKGHITTIDNRLGKATACQTNVKRFDLVGFVESIHGVAPWALPFGYQYDMAFIDADHDYPSVACDIGFCVAQVMPGGILCGHDYANTNFDVKAAVDQLVFNKDYVADFAVECGCWWARLK